jgi:K+ transporter
LRRGIAQKLSMAAAASTLKLKGVGQLPAQAGRFWPLTLGAIGVVYGDIGTSPIYAFREAVVAAAGEAQVTQAIVLGILSLIVWSLL